MSRPWPSLAQPLDEGAGRVADLGGLVVMALTWNVRGMGFTPT